MIQLFSFVILQKICLNLPKSSSVRLLLLHMNSSRLRLSVAIVSRSLMSANMSGQREREGLTLEPALPRFNLGMDVWVYVDDFRRR